MIRGEGVGFANWLVSKTSGFLDARLSRRSFISRATLVGTAVAATGCAVVTRPGSPYTYITDCPGGALCRDGYTEFCCVINQGVNACPPYTIPAGWWRADGSPYCDSGTRYYIDCNEECCGPQRRDGFCAGCEPCRCGAGCDTRKVHCNYFRYGQCNQGAAVGPIACRMVSCVPPYYLDIGCSPSGAVDNATRYHFTDCAPYVPPPPPPPAVPVSPNIGSTLAIGGGVPSIFVRVASGHVEQRHYDSGSTSWLADDLGGNVASRVEVVGDGTGNADLFARAASSYALITQHFDGSAWSGWQDLGGSLTSDPAACVLGGDVFTFVRGGEGACWYKRRTGSSWSGWQGLGGYTTSSATVATVGTQLYVFVRGGVAAGWYQRFDGSSWSGWQGLGGYLTSDPVPVALGSDLYVLVRGKEGACWYQKLDTTSSGLSGWQNLGQYLNSDPSTLADGAGGFWVFARGPSNELLTRRFDGTSWAAWDTQGSTLASGVAAMLDGPRPRVFARFDDGALHTQTFDGSTWSGWTAAAGAFEPVNGTS